MAIIGKFTLYVTMITGTRSVSTVVQGVTGV